MVGQGHVVRSMRWENHSSLDGDRGSALPQEPVLGPNRSEQFLSFPFSTYWICEYFSLFIASLIPPTLTVTTDGYHLLAELEHLGPAFEFWIFYWKKGPEPAVSFDLSFWCAIVRLGGLKSRNVSWLTRPSWALAETLNAVRSQAMLWVICLALWFPVIYCCLQKLGIILVPACGNSAILFGNTSIFTYCQPSWADQTGKMTRWTNSILLKGYINRTLKVWKFKMFTVFFTAVVVVEEIPFQPFSLPILNLWQLT